MNALHDSYDLCFFRLFSFVSLFSVALLVERGVCSFEQKAAVAMEAYPSVGFMVVYDHEISNNLVSMKETTEDHGITLGMLFVSNHAGMGTCSIAFFFLCCWNFDEFLFLLIAFIPYCVLP